MSIEIGLRALEEELDSLERVVSLFAAFLGAPTLRKIDDDRGFRYEAPDVRHFCLLKAIRAVSALNAAIELARKGYTQEISVLMRTLLECTTHIEFVLEDGTEEHQATVRKYIADFFADDRRSPSAEIRKAQVQQGKVHATLGQSLDRSCST
jgi:hypothetical protein